MTLPTPKFSSGDIVEISTDTPLKDFAFVGVIIDIVGGIRRLYIVKWIFRESEWTQVDGSHGILYHDELDLMMYCPKGAVH